MPRTRLIATVLTAAIAAASLTAPAHAGGSISIGIQPGSAKAERAMRAGFGLYSLVNGISSGASIRQLGTGNSGGIAQNGGGNRGIVHQEGSGHTGTLEQNGNNNAYGLFQFGRGTNAGIVQNGYGGTGATVVYGW